MKRSEMLSIITDHLEKECGLDFLGMNPEDVAEEILSLIESKGMSPPAFHSGRDVVYLPGRKIIRKFKSGWEHEDDSQD